MLTIENRMLACDPNGFSLLYEILRNGKVIEQGALPKMSLAACESKAIDVSAVASSAEMAARSGAEVFVTFKLLQDDPSPWASAGHVLAYEQFPWPVAYASRVAENSRGTFLAKRSGDDIEIAHGNGTYRISGKTGLPESMILSGKEALRRPMAWNFWRALTDNDKG
ncbi:beta-galactosidase domain 4-containing protein [Luteolibacter algae]|uniref:beta-galactosidase n=1 Tax=Luteolibacter algae TaxID=454151 RepID=A0ABW5D7P8_9BACT